MASLCAYVVKSIFFKNFALQSTLFLKRIISSLVLVLFLFNILGYGGLLMKLKGIASSKITQKLNTELYDMGGSMTIKMPYAGYIEPDYMVNLEIKQDGEIFRVIKQRQHADTLYLVCLRDEASTKINSAYEEFVQSFAGHDNDNQKNVKVEVEKNYLSSLIDLTPTENGWVKTLVHTSGSFDLTGVQSSPPTPPPPAFVA